MYLFQMKPIEYIGPVPTKKKRKPSVFGGWVILLLAAMFITRFAWPFFEGVAQASQDQPNDSFAEESYTLLNSRGKLGDRIAAAALKRTQADVKYDPSYYKIAYPMGDIPSDKGINTDLIIRSLRAAGYDLQELVHEDMKQHFLDYPQLWHLKNTDTNIDHRRIENLMRYFQRNHNALPITREDSDYKHGDIVIWRFLNGHVHIGIIVPGPGSHADEKWVVHNQNASPKWEDCLFDYNIIGHYEFIER